MKNKLSVEPYKGTRDFYPEDQFVQDYIFSVMRKIPRLFGYEEYNGPLIEDLDLYRAKTGEEIVNEQTYTFKDRGDREVAIRPEMTPTLARMVARRRQEIAFPARWFCIENNYRYERPQRGRLREHWQLNVDVFGIAGIAADAEVICVSSLILREFGLQEKDFSIRVSNRRLLNFLLSTYLKLNNEQAYRVTKLIDRARKMPVGEFTAELNKVSPVATKVIAELIQHQKVPDELLASPAGQETEELLKILRNLGMTNVILDLSVVRGFDYYTGPVFEVFDTNPVNRRSLFGGGRYDQLVDLFGVEPVTGTGFAMGDVTMRDVLETYKLLPEYKPNARLYLCPMNEQYFTPASELADELRRKGVSVAVDFTDRKIGAQIKAADKLKIPYVLVIGEDEIKSGKFKIKNLQAREEKEVPREQLAKFLSSSNLSS